MGVDRDYRCQVIKPEDFNEFWGLVLDELSSIELNVKCEKDELRSDSEITVYQVFYDSLDHVRISGWYSVPNTPVNGLPAILLVPGYQSDPPIPKDWSAKGYACLSVNPRGKVRSRSQFDPGYPGLLTHRIVDKNTYSYRGFYADAWRGIDFLLSRGEVDSERIGVAGSSQGGGLTITTSAMRKEIKAASAGAPYLCGFMDAIKLTDTYPYQEINDYLRTYPDRLEEVEGTLAYFDGISFADQIDCPIIMNLGLQDNVCPPETGYALFEIIGSKDKKLFEYEGHGHEAGRYVHSGIMDQFFDKHLKG
ncbi:MAG: acetylxylan esterase [SAR202 cluster bacterium]|jgi:cephalosporin-C deacetylase|nr:acetylxylan esterase [SAR202 cluster bacterium]HJO59570.1 acetylxylan esterase [SAR202 cluster bacterium]|tara:strand:+ start:10678 stop:11598 length:921 start_codon:yes stop_codon:yes gene_type:complete